MRAEKVCVFDRGRAIEVSECQEEDTDTEAYLSSIPDEQEGRAQKFVLDRGPRGERVDEEFDLGCVVLIDDRPWHSGGMFVENDIFHESLDRLSVKPRVEGKKTTCVEGARGRSPSLTR